MAGEDVTNIKDMTVEEVMAALGVSRARAEQLLAIENDTWEDDVQVVPDDQTSHTSSQHTSPQKTPALNIDPPPPHRARPREDKACHAPGCGAAALDRAGSWRWWPQRTPHRTRLRGPRSSCKDAAAQPAARW